MGMGGLSCGGTIAKWTLFFFNTIFWLCSLAILGTGIWLAVDPNAWDYVIIVEEGGMNDPLLEVAVYTMIGVGAFMFIVGFAGCWGACRESTGWLNFYCLLVIICLLAEITAGILAIVYKDAINDSIRDGMYEQVTERYGNEEDSDALTEAWDAMQQDLDCCGAHDYTDYKYSYFYNASDTSDLVPKSCCVPDSNYTMCLYHAEIDKTDSDILYTRGCYGELKSAIDDASYIIIGVMFGLAFLQLIGLLFACCVKNDIANSVDFA